MGDITAESVEVGHADEVTQLPSSGVTTKVVEHGEASALPEAKTRAQQWFVFTVTYALLLLTWRVVELTHDMVTLRMVARYSLALIGLSLFLFIAGASAEQCVKLLQAAKTTRKETLTTGGAPPVEPS